MSFNINLEKQVNDMLLDETLVSFVTFPQQVYIKKVVIGHFVHRPTCYWTRFPPVWFFTFFFSARLFCRFCVVIRFFHPSYNGQWPRNSKDFYTRSYPLHFLILILEKVPVFPFSMLSAKQGNYWYHFFDVFEPGPPALYH